MGHTKRTMPSDGDGYVYRAVIRQIKDTNDQTHYTTIVGPYNKVAPAKAAATAAKNRHERWGNPKYRVEVEVQKALPVWETVE